MTKQKTLRTVPAGGPFEPPLRRTALALLIAACFNAAHANPVLPQVVHGQATFNQQGNLFTITNTPNTIINWQSFSVNPGEITRFLQQNAGSSVLNRITGQDPSKILGSLQSNGKVFLINPNGVLFGRDARVDVAGLVASSLALSNQDFLAGKMNFNAGEQAGAVINQGTINAGSGGQILLIAPNVENSGIITAPNGDVLLAAGHSVQLADAANPDLRVVLSAPADQAINVGQIVAQGGRIGMVGALLNQRGVLNANSAVLGENGKIVLKATGKALLENGSVTSATSAAGKGGEITVLGDQVGLQGNAKVDASGAVGGGTVLLGGDYQGKNAAIANARQVAVESGASIKADAISSGDGGKVIVWGNQTARVYGSISARGGATSGNGGLVETSGHYLDIKGIRVDTASLRGKRGNWLIDPYDIEVVDGYGGELTSFDQFADAPALGTATIGAATISNAGSNVTLQAVRRINFDSAITMVNAGVGITATAGEMINVNAPITTLGGAVTLSANDASGGTAYGSGANLNLGTAITTNGGAVDLSGASVNGAGVINAGSGNLILRSNMAQGGINLGGSGDQLIGSGAYGQQFILQADNLSLTGGINLGGVAAYGEVIFKPLTSGRPVFVGNKPGNGLGLTNAELNHLSANTVTIGDATSGNLIVNQPVDLVNLGDNGVRNLNLETGGNLLVSTMLALRQSGATLRATAGGTLTVGAGGGLHASSAVNLVADNMSLGGAAQSISTASADENANAMVSLKRRSSSSGSIEVGSAAVDSASSLGLSTAELNTISAPAITIGGSDFGGTLKVQGGLDLSGLSGLTTLALRSGGGIALNGPVTVAKGLTLEGGDISATGAVSVGGEFLLDGGNWVQNAASLPAFSAYRFNVARGTFLRVTGGDGSVAAPYQIADVYGLQGVGKQINNNNYLLAGDIDASGTANWNQGAGFTPLFGGDEYAYSGIFDGGNHGIQGLTINGGANPSFFGSGLFARLQGGTIRNLAMVGGSVIGGNNVGALVGNNSEGTLSNVSSSMAVSGSSNVGGLVGANSGVISNASASGNVTGLGGGMSGNSVSGSSIGGLVGSNNSGGTITVARASGTVTGPGEQIGGLVGNNDGAISQAYATGGVGGGANVGGLVGRNGGSIADAYATGAIGLASNSDEMLTRQNVGGVIGWSMAGSSASRLYFSGHVSGNGFAFNTVGAVVGRADPGAAVGPASFDRQTAGTERDQGGSAGRTTAEMQQQSSFGGFNFGENAVWRIYDGYTTPLLKAFLTPLQVSTSGAASKVYDGLMASVGALSYVGLTNGDLGASGTASYGNALNVGNYALSGLWSTKYDITYAGSTMLAVTPRALSVILGGSKVYDGQLGFANATFTLANTVSGDTPGVTGSAQFVDKNAGTAKAVNLSGLALSGNALGNYSLAETASGTAEISRASLSLASVSAANKVYDGSTGASLSATFEGVFGADQVQLSGASANFIDKNVGASKDVNYSVASGNLGGSDAGNYVLNASTGKASAGITVRTLDLGFTGVNKTYDGGTAASLTITDNRIANDVLTATASAAFAEKNAGLGKTVTVTGASLSGTDAANYTLANTGGMATADITQRTLNLAFAGANKVYDGGTAATLTVTDNRVTGDVLTTTATGAFADKNAGAGKTVTVTGASLSGADAANYTLASTGGTATADITQRTLNLAFAGANKVYDGGTAAVVAVSDDRIANDVLSATASAAFSDKNAGTGKTVTVQNASLSGVDAANYVLGSTTGAATATITQRELVLGFVATGKTYDGNTAAIVAVTDNRIAGDVLTATASGAFVDKNAGANKAVTVQSASLSGVDASNYTLASTTGATSATITQRELALGFAAAGKTYDGNTVATLSVTDNRVVGDVLTATASGAFGDKNAGSNKVVTIQNASLSGADASNYTLASTTGATSATITQRALALGFTAAGKTYDGNTAATVAVTDNRVFGDVLTATASGAFGDKNAGSNKVVTVRNASLSGADASNYILASTTGATSATITQRELALGFAAAGKTYDGNTAATLAVTDNRVAGDALNVSASGAFADKNAGSNKVVTVQNASLSGTDASNYTLASTTGATSATITQRELALGFAAAGKTYDGNTAATLAVTDNRVAGDALNVSASGAFADKNAGSNKVVTVQNASLSGTDASNYTLASTTGATSATITQRELALGFAAAGKTYDGNTAATLAVTDNRVAGDALNVSASGAFADKNAGANKAVTIQNASLSGTDASNYMLASTTGATSATITQRELALGFAAAGKTYDGNTAAIVAVTDNRIAGDVLTATASGAFVDKNAGANKVVTVLNASLSGADASNYTLASTTGATSATITQRELALGFAAAGKTYDGNTAAIVAVTDNRIAGDALNVSASGAFADKNAGANKVVTVRNASLSGADSANYVLNSTTGATSATITQRELALGFAAAGKTYDGNTAAIVAVTDNRVDGDALNVSASGAFADKNAGSNKVVTVQNARLSGTDAANYVLASTTGATSATITQRELALGFAAAGKTYDGSTAATLVVTDNRVAGDVLTATASGAFGDKNAGANKAVTVQNASLSGADASNYILASTTGATSASIAQRELALGFVAAGKTYDGNTAATVAVTDNRVVGDVLTATASGAFGDKNAGANKAVTVQNASLSGADASNYILASTTGATSATITQRELALGFAAAGKTYDGNTAATVSVTDNRVAGDMLTATASGAFGDKNAGANKVVTVRNASLSGTDAANYALTSTTGTSSATITQRELALGFAAAGKTYDGNTAATVSVTDNRVAGDVLTATASGAFADKNAGANKAVTVQNASLSGTDAANYVLASTTGATSATITQRALALGFTAAGKTYDGSTAAMVAVTDNRVAGDVLTATASGAFGDKNAGANKAVTVQNASLSGADAANYVLASTTGATSATITQRELALGFAATGKTYDGNTAATVAVTDNRIAGDALNVSASGAFADKNAGTNKAVTIQNASLSGTDASNYMLASTTGATSATITQRELALGFTAAGKTYDGSTAAMVAVTDNRIAGDVLTATASGAFADKNAGANKVVTVQNASLSGTDASNYTLASTTGATSATITQRELALGFVAAGKTYDGNTAATVGITDNRIAGDVLTATASGAFADKNAGSNKVVTVRNASLSGADASNYTLASTTGATSASIAQRELALGFAAAGKTYDGSTAATVAVTDNRIAGDVLTATAAGAFADKNVGVNKAVTVQNASLSGTDAANYVLTSTTGATSATITQRELALGFAAAGKTYDGNTAATVAVTDNRVAGDVLTATASGAFGDKNAGANKAVTVQNASLSGADASNYTLASTTGATSATITQRALALGFTAAGKTYDGNTAATVGITDNRIAGDVLTATAVGAFADKNAGANKAVTVQNARLSGTDAANYVLASTTGATSATITQRELALGFAAAGKTYDGSTAATVAVTDNRIAGDVLTATASGAFADKNAGSGKTVTVQNASVSGTDAGNYRLASTGGVTTATIAQRTLSLAYTGVDKVYDGVTGAQVAISDNRIAGDVLSASASAAFADKNAGSGKTVTVQNASLSGSDAGNYRLATTAGTTSANIARAALTLASVSASDKVYDGTQVASVSGTVAGVIGQDAVSLAGGSGTFADRNFGTGKTVAVGGFQLAGSDAGNYALTSNSGVAQASIAQRALSTWIGAAGGLWSDAANWEGGVAPSGANVLAADFAASTGNVVYTAAAGDTVLNSMSSRGGLNLTGGSLLVNNALTVANYAQTGGLLGGLGNMTVSNSFSQSAGAINIGGNLAVTQAAGDLRFAALTANAISLKAGAGAISQSGAVVARSLATQSQTGTVLNDAGNRVKNFSAVNSGAGGIALTNTSAPDVLVLGGLSTGSGDVRIESTGGIESHAINANGGNVTLIAHSPVNVQGVIQGNDVTIDASTDVAFGDGARVNAARAIAVTAGTGVTFGGAATLDVQATGGITVLAKNGDLTAAETVRINSRGAPVSLLAPNGRVTVPASVLVAQPVTTPVVPPSTIISASNTLPAFSEQYNPLNQFNTPNNVTTPLLADTTSKESTKKATDDPQNGIKKTFCN